MDEHKDCIDRNHYEDIKDERNELAEQMNQLAEALLGYREGRFHEIIAKANDLKHLESVSDLVDCKEDILLAARSLCAAIEDL